MNQETYSIRITKNLNKKIRKLIKGDKRLDSRLRKVFKFLKIDPFYKGLRTHKVNTSKWGEVYSSRVTGDLRILWDFVEEELVILIIDIGGHEGSKSVY